MNTPELRWQQRLRNYSKALERLNAGVDLAQRRTLTDLEQQGLIQSFEFTHELAWKVLKDYFNYQGNNEIYGSRDATKEAFKFGLIENGDVWMDMISCRNRTSHTYDEAISKEIVTKILSQFDEELNELANRLSKIEP